MITVKPPVLDFVMVEEFASLVRVTVIWVSEFLTADSNVGATLSTFTLREVVA